MFAPPLGWTINPFYLGEAVLSGKFYEYEEKNGSSSHCN